MSTLICRIGSVHGWAQVTHAGGESDLLRDNDLLFAGDRLETSGNSSITLIYPNGSVQTFHGKLDIVLSDSILHFLTSRDASVLEPGASAIATVPISYNNPHDFAILPALVTGNSIVATLSALTDSEPLSSEELHQSKAAKKSAKSVVLLDEKKKRRQRVVPIVKSSSRFAKKPPTSSSLGKKINELTRDTRLNSFAWSMFHKKLGIEQLSSSSATVWVAGLVALTSLFKADEASATTGLAPEDNDASKHSQDNPVVMDAKLIDMGAYWHPYTAIEERADESGSSSITTPIPFIENAGIDHLNVPRIGAGAIGASNVVSGDSLSVYPVPETPGIPQTTPSESAGGAVTPSLNSVPVISGATGGAVADGGASTATGALAIADSDAGQSSFRPQFSIAGTYGTFTLDTNGQWTYTLDSGSAAVLALVDGQTVTDSFSAISNDGSAKQVVTITINGANEVAVIGGVNVGSVAEDNHTATGALTIVDPDADQANFVPQTSVAGTYGTFTLNADGQWVYTLNTNSPSVQGLIDGQTVTDSFTAVSNDGGSQQVVTITIHGADDAAVIGIPPVTNVTEDSGVNGSGNLVASGVIPITDVDQGQAVFNTTVTGAPGNLGSLVLATDGSYAYTVANSAVQYLGANDTKIDTFTITSADGTAKDVNFTIHGTNDAAVIGAPTVGDVTEDVSVVSGNLVAIGSISIGDVDQGQATFNTTVTGAQGNLGSLVLNSDGSYKYTVANSATQYLGVNDTKVDTFTIRSADGTSKDVSFTIHGTNDAAVIGTPTVANVTEDSGVNGSGNLVASGSISISDADQGQSAFSITVTSAAGNLGGLVLAADGTYTYTVANSTTQYLGANDTKVDTFTITSADGTSKDISFTIHGTNDAAVIGTPTVANVTEDVGVVSGNLVASGSISISDADQGQVVFNTTVTGAPGNLGSLVLAADGSYTYTVANSATQFLGANSTKVDTFTITSADGTSKGMSFTIHGTNDAAVIGTPTVSNVTEDSGVNGSGNLVANGSISISDVDQAQGAFSPVVTSAPGNLGSLILSAGGLYTYTVANSATQYLGANDTKVDTFTIRSFDGTSKDVSFTIHGTNDAAVIGTPTVANVTEDVGVVSGNLVASGSISISDVDQGQSVFNTTVTGASGNLGGLVLAADGTYTYTVANSAAQYLGANDTKVDTFTITSADGTSKDVNFTIHGTNDVAVIGTPTVVDVTEDVGVVSGNLVASGSVSVSDVDQGQSVFSTTVTSAAGNLGSLVLAADGTYTYTVANSAAQYLGANDTKVDTFTITSFDGIAKDISFTIHGTNDLPIIAGTHIGTVTEDVNVSADNLTTSGALTISDADAGQSSFIAQPSFAGTYGTFTLAADGTWTYSVNNSLAAIQALNAGESITDSFAAISQDGSGVQTITVVITGTNDGAVIGTPTVADVSEDVNVDASNNLVVSGSISISDVDQGQAAFNTTVTGASGNLGSLVLAANGTYTYTVANSAAQYLGANDTMVDTFTIMSVDGTSKDVSFTIHGTNDAAVIGTPTVVDVTEDINVDVSNNLVASGSISISDVDQNQAAFNTTVTSAQGNLGNLVLAADGTYTYTVANSAAQYLGDNDTKVDTFTITSSDGTSKDVSFTIHGTNDAAVIGTPTVVDVTEDVGVLSGNLVASGSISISDADQGQSVFSTTVTSAAGNLGSLVLAADGTYTYTVANSTTQYLGANDTKVDTFTITSVDGTSKDVNFTIHGSNDAAVIGTPTVVDVTEDVGVVSGNLVASGSVSVSDVDQGQSVFSTTVTSAVGNLGSLVLAVDGTYTYTVANNATQYLGANDTKVDTFTITSFDGTAKDISFTIHGTNDAAVIGTPTVANVTEDVGVISGNLMANGSISISDADQGQSAFSTTVTSAAGNLGSLVLAADGTYTYTVANSTTQYLGANDTKVDTFTITSSDGTSKDVSFTIHGTNDAAVIGTPTVANVTEDVGVVSGNLVASGSISISDADQSQSAFSTTVTGASGNLGSLVLAADGSYTYTVANSATQYLGANDTKVDTFTITSSDGTSKDVSFTINGTNDMPVIGGVDIGAVTKDSDVTAGHLTTSGTLTIADADAGQSSFIAQPSFAGTYGTFTLAADGTWTYSVDNSLLAVQELTSGQTLTDSFTALSEDGTAAQSITVTINGFNNVAVIGGVSVGSVTEDVNVTAGNLTTSGNLTISDSDPGQSSFTAQPSTAGQYGTFTLTADGTWTYTAHNSDMAIQSLGAGQSISDSFVAVSQDGTASQVVTVTIQGTNDAAVIGTPTVANVTEDVGVSSGNLVASGSISISDVDQGQAAFNTTVTGAQTNLGSLVLQSNGSYTYTVANSAVQFLGATNTKVDTFTITSSDGTSKNVSFTIHGTNDAAVIGTPTVSNVTEDSGVNGSGNLVASGSISISDVDQAQGLFNPAVISAPGNLGSLVLSAGGFYTYTVANSATQFLGANDTKVDTFTIRSFDGTLKDVSFTIHGTNDAAAIGTPTVTNVTEDIGVVSGNLVASGSISISDVDQGQAVFNATVASAPGNLGSLVLAANGSYTYTVANSSAQYLGVNDTKVDTFTITSSDGTSKDVSFTIHGTNDAAVIGTPTIADVTEDVGVVSGNLVASGSISISDADQSQGVFNTTVTNASGNLGSLVLAADGTYTYTVANSATQYLGANDTQVDTFTITSFDGTSKDVSFTIHGTNDAAVIGTPTIADVTEDVGVISGNLVASGSIAISDVDQGQAFFNTTVTNAPGNLGSLVLAADGTYTYTAANSAAQYLGANDTKVDTFTITSTDGTSKDVSFTIHGTNDLPFISGTSMGTVTEDVNVTAGNLTTGGVLTIADADAGQSSFIAQPSVAGTYGTFTLAADGMWTYSVNNNLAAIQELTSGESITDSFAALSQDGTAVQSVTVEIMGTDDTAVIGTPTVTDVTEDINVDVSNDLVASGSISISDADQGQAFFNTTVTNASGNLGSLVLAADGSYTYTVANSAAQYLGANDTKVDTFTITSTDGTSKDVSFTIHGTNDAAVIGTPTVADVTEDVGVVGSNLVASGSISISDADQSQSAFSTTVTGASGNLGSLVLAADGSYTYTVANSATQYLGANDTQVDTFTITSFDGTSKDVSFTIHGTNDAVVIGTPTVTDVTEDVNVDISNNLVVSGAISINDADQGQAIFNTTVTNASGNLGNLVLAADGSYTYTVANSATQYLGANDTQVDTFTITSFDGTSKDVSFTIHGTNDAAVIGTPTVTDVTEDVNVDISNNLVVSGAISINDADQGQAIFNTTVTNTSGNLGSLVLAADGSYTYTVANSATQYLGANDTQVDTFTITSFDGTSKDVSFTIHGTNDAAVIGTPTIADVTEDVGVVSGNLVASGSISISDADQGQAFLNTTVTNASGNLGSLVLAADGTYTYTVANSATQYLGANDTQVDTFTITSSDGASKDVSFTIHGTNDVAVIGTPTVTNVTEDIGVVSSNLVASGSIAISDVDQNQAVFNTTVAGAPGNLGSLVLAANGSYTYTVANSATQYLGASDTKVDTFTITSFDGTSKDVSFTIHGSNDAAVIGTPTIASVTEDGTVNGNGDLAVNGSISIFDADQGQGFFNTTVTSAQGNLGEFGIAADGSYGYSVANSAVQYLGANETKVDTFTITSIDGTSKDISFTIHGTNDVAVIGTPTVTDVTEDSGVNGSGNLVASGSISISDADQGQGTLNTTVTNHQGNLGNLVLAADGTYTYTVANSATQYLGANDTQTDTFTITSFDGTSKDVSFTIHGSNDVAVIGTPTVMDVTEDVGVVSGNLVASGSIAISDVDQGQAIFNTTVTSAAENAGSLVLGSNGSYTYTVANSAVQYLGANDTRVDTFTITSSDGTSKDVSFTIHGTNDAAVIGTPTVVNVTEDVGVVSGNLVASGSISISDADQGQAALNTTVTGAQGNLGSLILAADGSYTYTVANSAAQYLGANDTKVDTFTITSVDGTSKDVSFTIHGANDAAVIGTPTVANVTEDVGVVSGNLVASGSVSISDVDQGQAVFNTTVTGSQGNLGSLVLAANGTYTYTVANSATQYLGTNDTKVDTFTITAADGTSKDISFTIHGTNDAAVISGTSIGSVIEAGGVNNGTVGTPTVTGTLTDTDVDNPANTFQTVSTATASTNGYGTYTMTAGGVWTYNLDNTNATVQALNAGGTLSDSFTVLSADGTSKVVTITINGTNDAAVIGGTSTGSVTEAGGVNNGTVGTPTVTGTLTDTDVDNPANTFQAVSSATASTNGYGTYTMTAGGVWAYNLDNTNATVQALNAGGTLSDSFTVLSADGTSKVVTITINGTNDAAVIGGTSTGTVVEAGGVNNATVGTPTAIGTLTDTDVDNPANTFQAVSSATASTNGYGTYTMTAGGVWTYNLDNTNATVQALNAGGTLSDSFTVLSADGTTKVVTITINGTNDAAVIGGTSTGTVVEAGGVNNATVGTPTATGTLTDTDVDNPANTFQTVSTATASTNGYGTYTMTAGGVWTYNLDNTNATVQALNAGGTLSDSFTVLSADGTSKVVTITINGTNDAAVIGGTSTGTVVEAGGVSNATPGTPTATGTLTDTDVDNPANTFQTVSTATASTNGYGTYTMTAAGVWTYTLNNNNTTVQALNAGGTLSDSFTVLSADGTSKVVTITINGTNDAAVIGGTSTGTVVEAGGVNNATIGTPTATGTLTDTDVDNPANTFQTVSTATASTNGYGTYTMTAAGVWAYTLNNNNATVQGLNAGGTLSDSFTVLSADGTSKVVTITINGTNDAAVIGGTSTGSVTEAGGVNNGTAGTPTATGTLTDTDVDNPANTFQAVSTATASTNGYGTYTMTAGGVWVYTLDNTNAAVQALNTGGTLSDSFTVLSADGTSKVVTITINGTNDAAVIGGTSTGSVIEAGGVNNGTAGTPTATGTLTDTDVDNPANTFQAVNTATASTGGYGTYTMTAAGVWVYTLNNNNATVQALNAGGTLSDSFTVLSADGTSKVVTITINGTNDAAVIGGTSTGSVTEAGGVNNATAGTPTATGTLTDTDVDNPANTFQAVSIATASANGYGTYTMTAAGVWAYTLNNSNATVQGLNAGATLSDSFTVQSADGTSKVVTITINGTNDVPVISGTSTGSVTEDVNVSGGNLSTSGTLIITDVDTGQSSFVAQSSVAGTYGTFSLGTNGAWTYTVNDSLTAVQQLGAGQSITDTFTAVSQDGTASQVVTVTINGTNDTPVITGNVSPSVSELANIQSGYFGTATGNLTITDTDQGQSSFQTMNSVAGTYGQLSLTSAGAWTYNLTGESVGGGKTVQDVFTIYAADGTAQTFTMNITGNNDAPVGTDNEITAPSAETGFYTFTTADFGFTDPTDSASPNNFASVLINPLSSTAGGTLTINGLSVTSQTLITVADINNGVLKFQANASITGGVGDTSDNPMNSFTFKVRDDGGTANGGSNQDATARTMGIHVAPVLDVNFTLSATSSSGILPTLVSIVDVNIPWHTFFKVVGLDESASFNFNFAAEFPVTSSGTGAANTNQFLLGVETLDTSLKTVLSGVNLEGVALSGFSKTLGSGGQHGFTALLNAESLTTNSAQVQGATATSDKSGNFTDNSSASNYLYGTSGGSGTLQSTTSGGVNIFNAASDATHHYTLYDASGTSVMVYNPYDTAISGAAVLRVDGNQNLSLSAAPSGTVVTSDGVTLSQIHVIDITGYSGLPTGTGQQVSGGTNTLSLYASDVLNLSGYTRGDVVNMMSRENNTSYSQLNSLADGRVMIINGNGADTVNLQSTSSNASDTGSWVNTHITVQDTATQGYAVYTHTGTNGTVAIALVDTDINNVTGAV